MRDGFLELLRSETRSPEIPESEDIYGWLVGSWELDVLHYLATDVSTHGITGEAHFGWVLEGRAVQDVWIMPRPSLRTGYSDRTYNMYGTTLRIWSPAISAWLIRWINPVRGHEERQIDRRAGKDIVQIGARPDGTPTRWRFIEIAFDSFHWIGEALAAAGHRHHLLSPFGDVLSGWDAARLTSYAPEQGTGRTE